MAEPKYPVYIPTKGRHERPMTAKALAKDRVPFFLVVEPSEEKAYRAKFDAVECCTVLVLPNDDYQLWRARNWIKEHSIANGDKRHWQFDDNIMGYRRFYRGKRIRCHAGVAIRATEDFTDRYLNVAVSGMNYTMFAIGAKIPPFVVNCHVYSATLARNDEFRWRMPYNDDTDLCLQVLAAGWCTILMNAFLAEKVGTMQVKGGNTDDLYHGDGRLKMARALERRWPGVVTTGKRFNRPQHVVKGAWRHFDTQLIRDPEVTIPDEPNNYGMKLRALKAVKSEKLKQMLHEEND